MASNLFSHIVSPKLAPFVIKPSNYEKIRALGKGSYGSVNLVKNIDTNEKLAMKTITVDSSFSDDDIQSLYREIEIMAESKHPCVLNLKGFSLPDKKTRYASILIPFMTNGSLEDLLEKAKSKPKNLTFSRKLIILYGVAAGMQYLHRIKVLHRDLKPGNILLNDDYEPVIGDFGFSKFAETKEAMRMSMTGGTPLYMAPELYDNYTYGFKVDVYAFGMMAYELLTGIEPFHDVKNPAGIPQKVLKGTRPNIPSFIQKPFKELITSCWAQDPDDRPNFDEIVEGLTQLNLYNILKKEFLRNSSKKGVKKPKKKELSKHSSSSSNSEDENDTSDDANPEDDKDIQDEDDRNQLLQEYKQLKRYIERVLSQPFIFSTISQLSNETRELKSRVSALEKTIKDLVEQQKEMQASITKLSRKNRKTENSDSDSESNPKSDGFLFTSKKALPFEGRKINSKPQPSRDQKSRTPKIKGTPVIYNTLLAPAETPNRRGNKQNYNTLVDSSEQEMFVKYNSKRGLINLLLSKQRNPLEKSVIASQSSGDLYMIIHPNSSDRYTSSSETTSWLQFMFSSDIKLAGIKLTSSRRHFIKSWRLISFVEKKLLDSDDEDDSTSSKKLFLNRQNGNIVLNRSSDESDDENYPTSKRQLVQMQKIVVYKNDNEVELKKSHAELTVRFDRPVSGSIFRIEQTGPAWDGDNAISLKNVEFLAVKQGKAGNSESDSSDDEDRRRPRTYELFKKMISDEPENDPHHIPVLITSNEFDFQSYPLLNPQTFIQTYTKPSPPWFQVEFKYGKVQANGYRIKRHEQMTMRSWSLRASNDPDLSIEHWEVLDQETEERKGDFGIIASFHCSPKGYYKYFRVIQEGPSWDGSEALVVYHLDIFGNYKEEE